MYATLGLLTSSGVGGGGGTPPAAFPTLDLRAHSDHNTSGGGTTRTITLPSGITAGQRIVLAIATAASITTPPAGYALATAGQNVYHKQAVAGEPSSVNFVVSSSAAVSNHASFVFDGATKVAAIFSASASTANANSPSLTVPWGAANNLFMSVYFGMAPGNDISGYPANCPLYHLADETGLDEYHAGAESALATFDPDAFTTVANPHRTFTIGVSA